MSSTELDPSTDAYMARHGIPDAIVAQSNLAQAAAVEIRMSALLVKAGLNARGTGATSDYFYAHFINREGALAAAAVLRTVLTDVTIWKAEAALCSQSPWRAGGAVKAGQR